MIVELAERSGVPAATIKYYVRDGVLPPGERISGKRTEYSESHLRRLRLVRTLLEVGKLSTASVLDVLTALDAPGLDITYAFEIAQRALTRSVVATAGEPSADALARVDAVSERAGWAYSSGNIGRAIAAQVIDASAGSGLYLDDEHLDAYAAAADTVAAADMAALRDIADRSSAAEVMVIGTVLGDPLSAGLRRIAQTHYANRK